MMSQPRKQAIAIHLLPYISRGKSNHTIKFAHLIAGNLSNIFFEKSYTKCGDELFPGP